MDSDFQRPNLYVSLHLLLKSFAEKTEPPTEVKVFFESLGVKLTYIDDLSAEYLTNLSATDLRKDLPATSRQYLPSHIKSFIEQCGYIPPSSPDRLLNMTAFAARLAIDAYNMKRFNNGNSIMYEKNLLRFLNTHLLPALENIDSPGEELKKTLAALVYLLRVDRASLLAKFVAADAETAYSLT
ncbi:MAG: hypothetical protein NZ941_00080 [Candidatus Caldarchaeum sp.]|nr:hypothetical protein [Candidatus Caldarchaeum sp.]